MEAQGRDALDVPFQSRQLSLRAHVPDLDARIDATHGQASPVGMPGDDREACQSYRQVADMAALRRVIDRCNSVLGIRHRQPAVAWVESRRVGLGRQAPAARFLTTGNINHDNPIVFKDRRLPAVGTER